MECWLKYSEKPSLNFKDRYPEGYRNSHRNVPVIVPWSALRDDPEQILAGRPPLPECRTELHTDYDGDCVRWGLTHHKESAADCCQACLDQAKAAKPGEKKCNIWVYCPSETGCYSPDKYEHKHMECWLKYQDVTVRSQSEISTIHDHQQSIWDLATDSIECPVYM
ncbi:hypothetical protein GOBAR_AA26290 [Gossypium barbadense]|uniref:Apple domain-containing protein n=1 Tax=Gossypium barbadense TaxID=3634 RepID=A0A2P5WTG9_GOSBA|nr:hypothetical protein GOBAR_AA26290 [Gossypium barbadense]